MGAASWEFEEAIDCFKVIESSLRCIYAGEIHMYRVLSAQLRILLCDSPKPLLERLFPNLELQGLQAVENFYPGNFPIELEHLNALAAIGMPPVAISCMPFEARLYFNGIEDCLPLLRSDKLMIPVKDWTDQIISVNPVPLTIRQIIKTVADRGGGAHVHKSKDSLLVEVIGMAPNKLHLAALVLIAISKVIQKIGLQVFQFYEKNGTKGSIPLKDFDENHPSFVSAARVPRVCFDHPFQSVNLLSLGAR